MIIPVPTLSTSGWVTSLSEKADYLLAFFFQTDGLQSFLYGDNVSSMPVIIQKKQNDVPGLIELTRTTLENYLGNYYTHVAVDVQTDSETINNTTSRIQLYIYINVTEEDKTYSMGGLVQLIDGKFKEFIKENNTGGK